MKGFKVFILILLFAAAALPARQSQPELTLVTVYPGDEIYSAFGHTAFRYVDRDNNIDILYNFGTFDFRDPNFVPKFVQGQLDYFLGVVKFPREFKLYTMGENRTVVEQKLNLNPVEIELIHNFLTVNALPENRYYKYDFIRDNCSTRIQTVLDGTLGSDILYDQAAIAKIGEKSYRDYIRGHLKRAPWFDFGIQLALGMSLDQKVLPSGSFFLPALVYEIMEGSTLSDGRKLVSGSETLYKSTADPADGQTRISPPFLLFTLLLAVELGFIYLGIIRKKGWAKKSLSCYEYTLVVLNFLFGLLIFYLWFISDHTATKGNLNILWCSPLSLIFLISFFTKNHKVMRCFSLFMATMCVIFMLIMLVGIQCACGAFVPLLLLYAAVFGRRLFSNFS